MIPAAETHLHAELAANGKSMGRFNYPKSRHPILMSIMAGRYDQHIEGIDPERVHRVLDIGAGAGEFACWITLRYPLCWVDAYEDDEALLTLLKLNGPPGMRVSMGLETTGYDVVRLTQPGWEGVRGNLVTIHDYAERHA